MVAKRINSMNSPSNVVVLVATGSYNPIHLMHTQMFLEAREFIDKKLNMQVVAGIISPSSDHYVKSKLRRHGSSSDLLFSTKQRVQMCELATANFDWVFVSDWESNQREDVPFSEVVKHFEKVLESKTKIKVKVMYLCGLDHILKGVSLRSLEKNGVICVTRPGYDQQQAAHLIKRYSEFVHFVEAKMDDVSSTQIRARLKKRGSLETLVAPEVQKYLSEMKLQHISEV